ncbi:hypothetical protein OROHE_003104 [Orobanche hederae]
MPFPMRIQPIDAIRNGDVKPPVLKSRLKRLFDRPFNVVQRISSVEKQAAGGEKYGSGAAPAAPHLEPSSICLDRMIQSIIEDNNENQSAGNAAAAKCGRHRCNCFNGNTNDSSDDEFDFFPHSSISYPYVLIPCASMAERNLLAGASKFIDNKSRSCKSKHDFHEIVTDGLIAIGYNASVCKSKWEKSPSIPGGEYEYIDVIIKGERIIIDVEFRSEFEIARSTSTYKLILQCLSSIFVGKSDRLLPILTIVSEAARQSLRKKGMHVAPWRKAEYVKSKWLSPYSRITEPKVSTLHENDAVEEPAGAQPEPAVEEVSEAECGELDLIETASWESGTEESKSPMKVPGEATPLMTWQLPEVRPESLERGNKMVVVTGFASLLDEKL